MSNPTLTAQEQAALDTGTAAGIEYARFRVAYIGAADLRAARESAGYSHGTLAGTYFDSGFCRAFYAARDAEAARRSAPAVR